MRIHTLIVGFVLLVAGSTRAKAQAVRFNGMWEAKIVRDGTRPVTIRFGIHTRDSLVSGNVQRSDRPDPQDILDARVNGSAITFRTGSVQPTLYSGTIIGAELRITIQSAGAARSMTIVAKRNDEAGREH